MSITSPSPLTVDPASPPGRVTVKYDNVKADGFHLSWKESSRDSMDDPITAYILEYGESGGSDTPSCVISLSGVVEEYTVAGLKPHTEYHVKVAAENTAGRGPFCEPVPVQTAPDSE